MSVSSFLSRANNSAQVYQIDVGAVFQRLTFPSLIPPAVCQNRYKNDAD